MSFEPAILGRTGLKVGRLGLGVGYGIPAKAIEEAFERGVNYFYWGAFRMQGMGKTIRRLARKNRERMVVTVQNYWPSEGLIPKGVEKVLRELQLDYADILLFSTFRRRPNQKAIDSALELKEKGLVHHLGLACHLRSRYAQVEKEKVFDLYHIRYNAVHRGAEKDVFPLLPQEEGPGIVNYTATCWTKLLPPRYLPKGENVPRATDCYRFVLSHPSVHVCLSAPKNIEQTKENLDTLKMDSMSPEELEWMRRVGDHIYKKR
ncbi:MAG: aldo/keto reductase [Candidatus Zixiibacteriota bacterium]